MDEPKKPKKTAPNKLPRGTPRKLPPPRHGHRETEIQLEYGRVLTERQKTFAKHFVEGIYTNVECARRAGYADKAAKSKAVQLLNPKLFPHVLEYIAELREERERMYGVTLVGQLKRFQELSKGAEKAGQFSAAVNAEKIRSALGGLTIDRRETINKIDDLSREEIAARLAELQRKYPQVFTIDGKATEVIHGTGPRGKLLDVTPQAPSDE